MQEGRPRRPSPALVIAIIALFVALGGTGYAAITINGKNIRNRTITAAKVKRNTLGGTEINETKLGTVPRAATADSATSAKTASNAAHATNADQLAGTAAGLYAKAADIGAALAPVAITDATLMNGWVPFDTVSYKTAGYYKDQLGVVHLRGVIKGGLGIPFVLPVGLRPAELKPFAIPCGDPAPGVGVATIRPNGEILLQNVSQSCTTFASFEGITFRADD